VRDVPLIAVSAFTGKGIDQLMKAAFQARRIWSQRVSTGKLNRWFEDAITENPPPAPGGKRIKLRYITQAKTRPPGFVVKCSHPELLQESYKRYLVNGLRDDFNLPGVPVRLWFRGTADTNPFAGRTKPGRSKLRKHLGKPKPER
jgi:GTP-binding protein